LSPNTGFYIGIGKSDYKLLLCFLNQIPVLTLKTLTFQGKRYRIQTDDFESFLKSKYGEANLFLLKEEKEMKRLLETRLLALILIILGGTICFTLILGCSDKNPLDSDNNQADTDKLNKFGFPLAVGNQWVYHAEAEETLISSDTTVTRYNSEIIWKITAKERVLGVDAFRIETTQHFLSGPDSSKSIIVLSWFAAEGDTLRAIASGPEGGRISGAFQLHKISVLSDQDEPDEWPINVLVFPLKVGKEWWYFPQGHELQEVLGKKIVEAVDKISVPAGNFEAFRIVWSIIPDEAEDNKYLTIQWFTSVGMARVTEKIECKYQQQYDENGNLIDERSIKRIFFNTMELVSYQIKE